MKVRGTTAGTPLSARLTALCWGALTLLALVAVSACTSGSSTAPPTVFSPSVTTGTASVTTSASSAITSPSGSTSTPGVTSPASPSTSPATPEVTVTQTITVAPSTIPPAAPVTGGGGTAGLPGHAAPRARCGGDPGRRRGPGLPQVARPGPLRRPARHIRLGLAPVTSWPGGELRLGSRERPGGGRADGRGPGAGPVGTAAAGAHRGPGPDHHLRRVRGAGRGHGHAGGRPRPGRPAPVRLGIQRVHARQRGRHRGGRPGGRPAGSRGAVRGRGGAVRLRAGRGGPGSLDGGAGGGPGDAGPRRRRGALGGLCHHRPEPARDAARPDDGRPVDRVGRARPGRPGDQRRGGAPVRMAVGVPGPAAGGRDRRVDRRARPDPARAAPGVCRRGSTG